MAKKATTTAIKTDLSVYQSEKYYLESSFNEICKKAIPVNVFSSNGYDNYTLSSIEDLKDMDFEKLVSIPSDYFKDVFLTAAARVRLSDKKVSYKNPYVVFINSFVKVWGKDSLEHEARKKHEEERKKSEKETVKSGAEIAEENYTNELNAITAAVTAGIMTKTEGKKQVADLKKKYGK